MKVVTAIGETLSADDLHDLEGSAQRNRMMVAQAREAVLNSGHLLTLEVLGALTGLNATNLNVQLNGWQQQGRIFAIRHNAIDYFPRYGLDSNNRIRPLKSLAQVMAVFAGHRDAWGMAFWFVAVNSFLGGRCPQDVLATDPERVIGAAKYEMRGVVHG